VSDWTGHSHKEQAVGGAEEGGKMNSSNIIVDFLRSKNLTGPDNKKNQ
jgi:hypothetical protein